MKQTKKVVKPKSKLENMEAKLFSSLTTSAKASKESNNGWEEDNESADLDFNDLEISFDKK